MIFTGGIVSLQVTLLIFIVLVLLSVIFFNRIYCLYLCPLGGLTELLNLIKTKVFKIKNINFKHMVFSETRYWFTTFVFTYAVLFNNLEVELEPQYFIFLKSFNIFLIIFSGLVIILSLLAKRAWCRFFCPSGVFFELIIYIKMQILKKFKK